jgi:hypothetical protein
MLFSGSVTPETLINNADMAIGPRMLHPAPAASKLNPTSHKTAPADEHQAAKASKVVKIQ